MTFQTDQKVAKTKEYSDDQAMEETDEYFDNKDTKKAVPGLAKNRKQHFFYVWRKRATQSREPQRYEFVAYV